MQTQQQNLPSTLGSISVRRKKAVPIFLATYSFLTHFPKRRDISFCWIQTNSGSLGFTESASLTYQAALAPLSWEFAGLVHLFSCVSAHSSWMFTRSWRGNSSYFSQDVSVRHCITQTTVTTHRIQSEGGPCLPRLQKTLPPGSWPKNSGDRRMAGLEWTAWLRVRDWGGQSAALGRTCPLFELLMNIFIFAKAFLKRYTLNKTSF